MNKKQGFTLIEILVVISIIAIMSSIVLTVVTSARRKAEYARAKAQITQFMRDVRIVNIATDRVLGVYRSACPFVTDHNRGMTRQSSTARYCTAGTDLRNVTNDCSNLYDTSMTNLESVANAHVPGIKQSMHRDPWGSPYILDENEGEFCTDRCRPDRIGTVGPDGRLGTRDDMFFYIPLYSAECGG